MRVTSPVTQDVATAVVIITANICHCHTTAVVIITANISHYHTITAYICHCHTTNYDGRQWFVSIQSLYHRPRPHNCHPCDILLTLTFTRLHTTEPKLPCTEITCYTLCPKKESHLMFDNNYGKCGLFFQNSFTNRFVRKFSMYTYKDFHLTCNMLLHYLVKLENPKMLLILTASSTNCWHVPEDTLRTWVNI